MPSPAVCRRRHRKDRQEQGQGEGSGGHGDEQSRMSYMCGNITTKAVIPTLTSNDTMNYTRS